MVRVDFWPITVFPGDLEGSWSSEGAPGNERAVGCPRRLDSMPFHQGETLGGVSAVIAMDDGIPGGENIAWPGRHTPWRALTPAS
jgi:hypothetical protein